MSSQLLCWLGKERLWSHCYHLFHLGVKEVGDVFNALKSQRILKFDETQQLLPIPPNYVFISQQLQNVTLMQDPLPLQVEEQSC